MMNKFVIGGIDHNNGQFVQNEQHLFLSIIDILTTQEGSRLCLRGYGSRIFDLIDRPKNSLLHVDMAAAITDALNKWEPRVNVSQIVLNNSNANGFIVDIYGTYTGSGKQFVFNNLELYKK